MKFYLTFILILISVLPSLCQHSVARVWNEVLLKSIRGDFARPTVHARNLFHVSAAMYDAFAIYDELASTYYLGKQLNQSNCVVSNVKTPDDIQKAQETAICFAAYSLIIHRFDASPQRTLNLIRARQTLDSLGYDINFESIDYENDGAAALGNYIAKCYIEYGLQDGSNEQQAYNNTFYTPVNEPLDPSQPGNPDVVDPNRWQPLKLDEIIDQSGNLIDENITTALSPEWGNVWPFSFSATDKNIIVKNGNNYSVYLDPGPPPLFDGAENELYKEGFEMVCLWSAHLSSNDNVLWDISPASMGNVTEFPANLTEYASLYNIYDGGDFGTGHAINPITNQTYESNIVNRGDFTRVLAEFWADGPDSETPPGHWFTILNYVNDHPLHINKFEGEGDTLSSLEWDVLSYFILGSAMHDAAVSTWSIKGYYDYTRPVSAIRYLADLGQCTDESLPNYHANGINLYEGYIELVKEDDILVGSNLENLNKVKVKSWRGPEYIANPDFTTAGVGWILAENWWPYQRPSFVTPPFSGYVSGHSTFSAAAAEVLSLLTGSAYFPGGLGEFFIQKNEFLVFENGPSESFKLQWATYKDAANQSALSRIWGGIHPPADDIPGRKNGTIIGNKVFELAKKYYLGEIGFDSIPALEGMIIFPNPCTNFLKMNLPENFRNIPIQIEINTMDGKKIRQNSYNLSTNIVSNYVADLDKGIYFVVVSSDTEKVAHKFLKF